MTPLQIGPDVIPYASQNIDQNDIDEVVKVLSSDLITQGPAGPKFEGIVAKYCDANFSVATNSATSSLHIACLALGLKPNDWVWTSANTFVASANCALYCGAKVDFVDINPETYNLCVKSLKTKLERAKEAGTLPKIVIPVHFAGNPCEMKDIHDLSLEFGFRIIEDASHALGATHQQKRIGSCKYSDIVVFSFHPVKMITTAEGGMALTNSHELANKMERLRSHGVTRDSSMMKARNDQEIWNYQQLDLGFNYRLSDINAALGISQMERLDEFVALRQAIAAKYSQQLAGLPLKLQKVKNDASSSFHIYVVRIDSAKTNKTQTAVHNFLIKHGIGVNLHYIPVYLQPYFESLGFRPGLCKEAEAYFKETITLPLFPNLSDVQQEYIVKTLGAAFA